MSVRFLNNTNNSSNSNSPIIDLNIYENINKLKENNKKINSSLDNHKNNKNNPHGIALEQLKDIEFIDPIDNQFLMFKNGKITNKDIDINVSDEKVKLSSNDTSGFLEDKIDNATIIIKNNKLVVKTLNGLEVNIAELNTLNGIKDNIQKQINNLTRMEYKGQFSSYSDLIKLFNPKSGWTAIVKNDENHENKKMFYIYDGTLWEATYEVSAASSMGRDFITDKIDLIKETKGILSIERIPNEIAKQIDVDKKITKIANATQNNIAILNADGSLKDSGKTLNDYSKIAHKHKDLEKQIDLKADINNLHQHENKNVLDNFFDDGTGLKYNGKKIDCEQQILEYEQKTFFPTIGEANKFYIDRTKNIQYRWDNTKKQYIAYNQSNNNVNIENIWGTFEL